MRNEDGEEESYQIVGVDEVNPEEGRISAISPLGRALPLPPRRKPSPLPNPRRSSPIHHPQSPLQTETSRLNACGEDENAVGRRGLTRRLARGRPCACPRPLASSLRLPRPGALPLGRVP